MAQGNFTEIAHAALENTPNKGSEAEYVQQRLYELIDYAKERYHWYEDQREKKLSLGLSMVALSGVAISLFVNSAKPDGIDLSSIEFRLSGLILLTLVLTSFGVVIVYLRGQNLEYTHRRELNSIFSWYGYGVPKIEKVGVFEYFVFGRYSDLTLTSKNDPAVEDKRNVLLRGFKEFSSEVTRRLNVRPEAYDEDLQQIYILQIFQVIARENLQMMVSVLKGGVIIIALLTIGLAIILLLNGIPA